MIGSTTTEYDDLELLLSLGQRLDASAGACGYTIRELLMRVLLKIRDRQGRLVPLAPNQAQCAYAENCTRRNIVLKARQLGITTYIAARFFVHTITRPGTLTVQVAHDQRSAEEIFRIVHRFLENLPEAISQREIVDEDKFKDGLGKVIDGVVQCLNASAWAKAK